MRYRFARPEGTLALDCGIGGLARAGVFPVAEKCSTDERIGQVGVAHNNLGCTPLN